MPSSVPGKQLRMVVRTPHEVVFDQALTSLRVPTKTGQVGLRPRSEPMVLVVEAGLMLFKDTAAARLFVATAGGLLRVTRAETTLYTPFAVVGDSAEEVLRLLEEASTDPTSELKAHRQVEELERRILREVTHADASPSSLGRPRG